MRKGLAYLDLAERCRKLADQVKEPRHKKELAGMARLWGRAAAERAKQLAKPARKAPRKSKRAMSPACRQPIFRLFRPRPARHNCPQDVMRLPRRKLLHPATGMAALPMLSRLADAQTYPARPVRIVAAFAAGGGVDITARLIGQWLSDRLGQSFVVDNRPGAGGNIGTEAVVNAPPDGHTLLLATLPNAVNATLYDKLNFKFIRDTAPIWSIIRVSMVILVHPSVLARTVPELIAYAKANPGKVNMASAGAGSAPHMAGELFNYMAGVKMVHVPYRGQGPALSDLLGGQVQVF